MKKIISVAVLAVMVFLSIAVFASAEQITSTSSGFSNVTFSNGYHGFCIDADLSGAYSGDSFTSADDTSAAENNDDKRDVSQQLKILFVLCFEDMFVSDGNGGYVMDSLKASSSVQTAVWHFTDGQYIYSESKTFVERVNAYDGPEIPDEGYVLQLANGDNITFYFMVVEPQKDGQQSFFAYKIAVNEEPEHTHDYNKEWSGDDTDHWHECECGDKKDVNPHEGNEADCVTESVCDECGKKLGDVDPENHTGNTEIKNDKPATEFEKGYTGDTYCSDCEELIEKGEEIPATHTHDYSNAWSGDGDNHWHECECGDKKDVEPHEGNVADCVTESVCNECAKKFGDVDPENHIGNTEIRNDKPATEFEKGYTGDTYCSDCGELIEKGEEIPATHNHDYSDEWSSDGDNHWHECECGDKKDSAPHTFINGECSVCGEPDANADDDTDGDDDADKDDDAGVNDGTGSDNDADVDDGTGSDDDADVDDGTDKDDDANVNDGAGSNGDADVDNDTDADVDADKETDKDADKNEGADTISPDTDTESYTAIIISVLILIMCSIVFAIRFKRKDSAV